MKYFVIHLIWENKDILKENYKIPMGKIKEDINKWTYLLRRKNTWDIKYYKDS